MNLTFLLIGLGVIVLLIVGKVFAILTRIFLVIILIAAIAAGIFFYNQKQTSSMDKSGIEYAAFYLGRRN